MPPESLTFYVPLCGDEVLRELSVETASGDSEDGDVIWRMEAIDDGVAARMVRFGDPPSSFTGEGETSLNDLANSHGARDLAVKAATDEVSGVVAIFAIDELPTDGSVQLESAGRNYRSVGLRELGEAQHDACSPSALQQAVTVILRLGIGFAALGGVVWFFVRRRQSPADPVVDR